MAKAEYSEHFCSEIAPGLLCGSVAALGHIRELRVTSVLSLIEAFLNVKRMTGLGHVDHLQIEASDVEDTNLLEFLEKAHAFIDEGLQKVHGRVLVHCMAGRSRSVSVTVAYIMKKNQLSVDQALKQMDEIYPHACPNSGFLDQLEMFHKAGYDYQRALADYNSGSSGLLSLDPVRMTRYYGENKEGNEAKSETPNHLPFTYECRKCHVLLGDSSSVHKAVDVDICSKSGSLFVEQLDWMSQQSDKGENSGKLYCPRCGEKLGSFSWSGISDNVVWHVPGFQLHLDKLDIRSSTQDINSILRQPRLVSNQGSEGNQKGESAFFEFFVFDCDGVLVNTEASSCESLYLCIKELSGFDIPRKFPEEFYEVFGMDVRSCLEHYNQKFHLQWEDIEDMTVKALGSKEKHYERLTADNGLHAFEGVVSVIETLRRRHIPYGVASSGHPSKIKRNLEQSGLIDLFDPSRVVSASEVAKGKPAPDVYLEAFQRVGCGGCPSKCLVIEDSIAGLQAARAAGAFCVGITNSLPRSLLEPHADLVVDQFSELENYIPPANESLN